MALKFHLYAELSSQGTQTQWKTTSCVQEFGKQNSDDHYQEHLKCILRKYYWPTSEGSLQLKKYYYVCVLAYVYMPAHVDSSLISPCRHQGSSSGLQL